MKTVLVTGLNGRLAPYLKTQLMQNDIRVVTYDRGLLPIDDVAVQQSFIEKQAIDAICHLATGPESWAASLAKTAYERDLTFVFTSTESVFNPNSRGPFTPDHPADADSDYGRYKILCEQAVTEANPKAIIARLGWQMFDHFDADNLLTHVRDMHDENGYLEASTEWLPAVAYVGHTMASLQALLLAGTPGTYHIGGNESGLSFYELVQRINHHYRLGWDVRPGTTPARDGRIIDTRVPCGRIEDSLSNPL